MGKSILEVDLTKPIILLTGEELIAILTEGYPIQSAAANQKHYCYGIDGLAKLLGCSKPTAQRIRCSGVIDEATIENGRTMVFDSDMVMNILRTTNSYKKYPQKKADGKR